MNPATDRFTAAQRALDQGRWAEAGAEFQTLAIENGDTAAYEGLAQVAWWRDDGSGCLAAREAAYRHFRDSGDDLGAARAATSLAWDAVLFGQGEGVGRGWLRRAAELLQDRPEAVEHGWLAVREAEFAHEVDRDAEAARFAAERATAIGVRLGEGDLEITGRAIGGLALVEAGSTGEGMARLDAAVTAATAGDVTDPMWMGKICCWLVFACAETQDVERAADWCRRVEEISARRGLQPLSDFCQVQYASLQVLQGAWIEAERGLVAAMERLAGSRRTTGLAATVQLGELRRRQGRYDEAEELLRLAEFVPAAVVSRALVRLARGEAATGSAAVQRLLREVPTNDLLGRAAVLPAAVVTATAAGDVAAAGTAAAELREIADTVGTDRLLGLAAVSAAMVAHGGDAAACWWEAVRRFSTCGSRFDEAEARLALAETLLGAGDRAGATEQLTTAARHFEALGAPVQLSRTRALLDGIDGSGNPLSTRQTEVLALVARGLTNVEIARELHLSEHTVHRHLANILVALGLGSRAAAVAYATKTGLI